jgi:hypothetical protein
MAGIVFIPAFEWERRGVLVREAGAPMGPHGEARSLVLFAGAPARAVGPGPPHSVRVTHLRDAAVSQGGASPRAQAEA